MADDAAAPLVKEGSPTGELADAPPGGAPAGDSPRPEAGEETPPREIRVPDPDAPPAEVEVVGGVPPEGSGASPEPPPVPEVIKPDDPGVVDAGNGTFLLDLDGDGFFETKVAGEALDDGTIKVVESATLNEPIAAKEFDPPLGGDGAADEPAAGGGPPLGPEIDFENPPPTREAPNDEAPGGGGAPPTTGEGRNDGPAPLEIDLPAELYEPPPAYASGAEGTGGHVGATAASDEPAPAASDPGTEPDEQSAEPIVLRAPEDDDDADDPGLLERVASTMGDIWDDATDVVT